MDRLMASDGLSCWVVVIPPWVAGLVPTVGLIAILALLAWAYRLRRRLRRVGEKRDAIAGGERRMFSYLHVLGMMIEKDCRPRKLYRIIVEGVEEVVGADAGALYLLDEEGAFLSPSFLSEGCPAFGSLGSAVWAKGRDDPAYLGSHLRLTKVPAGEGLLGACLASADGLQVRRMQE